MGKLVCVLINEQNILQTTPKIPFKSLRTYEYSKEEFPSVSVVNPWKNAIPVTRNYFLVELQLLLKIN